MLVVILIASVHALLGYRGPSAAEDPPEFVFPTSFLPVDVPPINPAVPNRNFMHPYIGVLSHNHHLHFRLLPVVVADHTIIKLDDFVNQEN